MKKAVLFDLDGTLLDTTEGVLESAEHAARELGLPDLPRETMLKFVGPPIQMSFIDYYGVTCETAQEAANAFRAYYKEHALLKARPYPGMQEVLRALCALGVKIGVATYKREDYAITILEHFGIAPFCQAMHGADHFNRLTKADIVNLCIRELGARLEDTVMIGDTEHDAKGASLAGVDFIAVTFGFGFRSPLDVGNYPSMGCADSLPEVLDLILQRKK